MSRVVLFLLTTIWCACEAYHVLVIFPVPGRSHSILGDGYVRNLLEAGHEMSRVALFFFTTIWGACEAYHVLVIFPVPGRSHGILGDGYVRNLLEAGHEVTYITPFPDKKNTNSKLHIIEVDETLKLIEEETISLKNFIDYKVLPIDFEKFKKIVVDLNKIVFRNNKVQKMLKDENVIFDVVVTEWMMSEFGATYAAYYDVPFIYSVSTEPHSLVLSLVDEASNPAYTPSIFSNQMPPFSFVQRVKELIIDYGLNLIRYFFVEKEDALFYEQNMAPLIAKKGRVPPPYEVLKYNASLILGNSHVSLGSAIRLPQSYKPIGGYHIDTKLPPLPEDLKKILDSASHGVIYFSMGSNFKSKDLPDSIKTELLQLFGSLQQTVVWKFEEVLPNVPKNVHIIKWAPQTSILAHPKIKVFITHGGLLSTTESVHFGVPTIVVPVFGDQFTNADRSVKKGFAYKVELSYNLASDLKVAIKEILGNPTYSNKVKQLSVLYHDRPVTPGRELVHWVEHVVKTRGAPHLRSPALSTPWYQKMYLDLLALILLTLILLKKLITYACCGRKIDLKKKKHD